MFTRVLWFELYCAAELSAVKRCTISRTFSKTLYADEMHASLT